VRPGTIHTSYDGTSWNERTYGITNDLWGGTYGNNIFVTVGGYGTIFTSSDGNSWIKKTSGTRYILWGATYSQ
jgi:hypothetical protein